MTGRIIPGMDPSDLQAAIEAELAAAQEAMAPRGPRNFRAPRLPRPMGTPAAAAARELSSAAGASARGIDRLIDEVAADIAAFRSRENDVNLPDPIRSNWPFDARKSGVAEVYGLNPMLVDDVWGPVVPGLYPPAPDFDVSWEAPERFLDIEWDPTQQDRWSRNPLRWHDLVEFAPEPIFHSDEIRPYAAGHQEGVLNRLERRVEEGNMFAKAGMPRPAALSHILGEQQVLPGAVFPHTTFKMFDDRSLIREDPLEIDTPTRAWESRAVRSVEDQQELLDAYAGRMPPGAAVDIPTPEELSDALAHATNPMRAAAVSQSPEVFLKNTRSFDPLNNLLMKLRGNEILTGVKASTTPMGALAGLGLGAAGLAAPVIADTAKGFWDKVNPFD